VFLIQKMHNIHEVKKFLNQKSRNRISFLDIELKKAEFLEFSFLIVK